MTDSYNIVTGAAQGVDDTLIGTRGDDSISGYSGDDYLVGGRGNDVLIGGRGSDVMTGGMDTDTFVWSAGHIGDGDVDYVTDFNLRQGDTLEFLSSGGGQDIQILSVELSYNQDTEFNGIDLSNNVDYGTDVIFTVQNTVTGATMEIVLLDSWSHAMDGLWDNFFASQGLNFDLYAGNALVA